MSKKVWEKTNEELEKMTIKEVNEGITEANTELQRQEELAKLRDLISKIKKVGKK